jgi:hypothetical protein
MRTDWREGQGTCFRAKMPDAEDVLLGELGALAVVGWRRVISVGAAARRLKVAAGR